MKHIFEKLNCPFLLKIKGIEWSAVVHLKKDGYYINYTNNEWFKVAPLDIDYEVIEAEGEELEDAIIDLKKILKDKKLLKSEVYLKGLTKNNIRVRIRNESMQKQAIEILEKHKQELANKVWWLDDYDGYIVYDSRNHHWLTSRTKEVQYTRKEITLDELDEILINQHT